jgi:dihydrofolate reductase
MTLVTAQMSVSLDGFYAGPTSPDIDIHNWMGSEEALGFDRVTRWVVDAMGWRERQGLEGGQDNINSKILSEGFESAGAYLMGRRMFDGGEQPWGDEPPFRAPVFVVTHRPKETVHKQGGTSFIFVTDGIAAAAEQARAAANGKNVAVAGGGSFLRAVIAAGVLEQLDLHIVPVLLGQGMRLFEPAGLGIPAGQALELTPTQVVATPEVTHIRYTLDGREPLVVDDRFSGETAE